MRKIKKWVDRIPDGLYLVLTGAVFIIVVAVLMYLAFHDDSIYEKDDVEEQIKKAD